MNFSSYLPTSLNQQTQDLIQLFRSGKIGQSILLDIPEGNLEMSLIDSLLSTVLDKPDLDILNQVDIQHVFPAETKSTYVPRLRRDDTEKWAEFTENEIIFGKADWLSSLNLKNKQPKISVGDAQLINQFLLEKPYQFPYKFVLLWYPEEMNLPTANKLLKSIEEPPHNTFIIGITHRRNKILPTILSRFYVHKFDILPQDEFIDVLTKVTSITQLEAKLLYIRSESNLAKAKQFLSPQSVESDTLFVNWMRLLYKADLRQLSALSEKVADMSREDQKMFMNRCLENFRLAYFVGQDLYAEQENLLDIDGFNLKAFSKFIHDKNVSLLAEEFEQALYFIERNSTTKLTLLNLSIKVARYLRIKL